MICSNKIVFYLNYLLYNITTSTTLIKVLLIWKGGGDHEI